jgi:type II secretory pathway pseudopilin PulG
MLIKPIIALFLLIAISALGLSYTGDGFLGFNSDAKAQTAIEQTRDMSSILQTYKTADISNLSLPFKIDNEIGGLVDNGTAEDNAVTYADVIEALRAEELFRGQDQVDFGSFGIGISTSDEIFVVNSGQSLTPELCEKMNKVLGYEDASGSSAITADLSGFTAVLTDVDGNPDPAAAIDQASVDALVGAAGAANGGVEGACVTDDTTGTSAFAYFVQKL